MTRKKIERTIYLEDVPRQQALKQLLSHFRMPREVEWVPTVKALGRVTAEPIYACLSMPHYHASAMDGIAVRAEDTYGAHEQRPKQLVEGETFEYVDTGDPIPAGYNAVIMIEHVQELGEGKVQIIEPATPWQHIRPVGEDVVSGEMLLPQGHVIRPVDQGALLAGGILSVPVVKKPVVSIIPTGSELVQPTIDVTPGQIIEFNGTVFAGYIEQWGGSPRYYGIVKDDPEEIRAAILDCVRTSDIVLLNAGSSAGSEDFTVHLIAELGEVFTHGVATRPGKPVVLGKVEDTPVIGLPGYPVSAYLTLEWFVQPLICHYLGVSVPKRPKLEVTLGRRLVSTMGSEDFVRLNIGYVNGKYVANPLTRAAGVTMSLVKADGLLIVPPESLGYEQGEKVTVELYKPLETIRKSILFSGSHDLSIDLLSSLIKERDQDRQIISSHTGSMAGLMAIKKGETHVAGIHLLDEESGMYNIPFVQRYLKDEDVVLVRFLQREQGWIVPKGNPHQISSVQDIVDKNLIYVNRQRGAGTRILFDSLLAQNDLSVNDIRGYEREVYSHLNVAAAVKEGTADVGLGIYSAAKALDLDFVPVADESYDLLMSREFYESEGGQLLLAVMVSEAFKIQIEQLGGYKVKDIGQVVDLFSADLF
ncbi:molybdenum cofactor synthesis domain protein [Caldalkalibacillus thermarum TA2.A1]|uniref:Molybdopterin molybdenumtransferase n=1 Tax=Caldalkalibacillus thermarum (strain TA2.A1) TaxID=986075 RepID=F5LAI3_CALTT|nr:molybdopterin biosynthesis protein [Caldalkalibacillus thermarum]EGL81732.1 molybdenum cofactor synthesis domain protein [Caldalkalibacillus thermarum TA2.A1]